MCGVIKLYRIRNHYINGSLEIMDNPGKTRDGSRWFGCAEGRNIDKIVNKIGKIRVEWNRVRDVDQEKVDKGYWERYEGMWWGEKGMDI